MLSDFLEHLSYGSRDKSSVLIVGGRPVHGKSFTRSSLAVAENGAVEAACNLLADVLSAVFEDVFLRRVVHEAVKFEFP